MPTDKVMTLISCVIIPALCAQNLMIAPLSDLRYDWKSKSLAAYICSFTCLTEGS